jgi:hypothetical protein
MKTLFIILFISLSSSAFASEKTNPDISLNTLFTWKNGSQGNAGDTDSPNGFDLQEAELRMTANIDTHFRGDVILAVEREESDTPGELGEFVLEPEEVFVDTIGLSGFNIRAGKFFPYWGRTNQWHTHALPFVDHNLSRNAIFGDEGFNESGIAASFLLPTSWYFEIIPQVFSAKNQSVFGSADNDSVATVLFIKNFWDISNTSSFEINLGVANGKNINEEDNNIQNVALTYKNKFSAEKSFTWSVEMNSAEHFSDDTSPDIVQVTATSTWLQYQITKPWWVQGRYEVVSKDDANTDDLTKSSLLIGYVPSEFSAIRLQYDQIDDPNEDDTETQVTLQLNLTMGTHPAHSY